jgi:hypothetical protein
VSPCRRLLVSALVACVAAPSLAQARWTLVGSDAHVRVDVGPASLLLRGTRAFAASPAGGGQCSVVFGVDAVGQPEQLRFEVPPGADVELAIEAAARAAHADVVVDGEGWSDAVAGGSAVRITGDSERRDCRIEARFDGFTPSARAGDEAFVGVVARWHGPDDHYAFRYLAPGGFRIERRIGGHTLVLATAPWIPSSRRPLRLSFEVHGFRLRGFVDDELFVESLDGALTEGRFGWCWHGERPTLARMTVGPPAPPRPSAALVREPGTSATLHVAGPLPQGHWAALELRLDRPGPLVPLTDSGLEPWLLHAPVRPFVLGVPALQRLGPALVEVPGRGQLACRLEWPDLPGLRGQVALARFLFVAADGSLAPAVTPAVPLRL